MANEQCWLPSSSFRINFKEISSLFFINPLRLNLSLEILYNFLSELHIPPRLGKVFKLMVFRLLENTFGNKKKNWKYLYHRHLDKGIFPIPLQAAFFLRGMRELSIRGWTSKKWTENMECIGERHENEL